MPTIANLIPIFIATLRPFLSAIVPNIKIPMMFNP